MVKVVIDAGHGYHTPGKRTPDDEREWSFNNKVAIACINKLKTYHNVQILRTDDPTGKTDTPLAARTNQANRYGADVLVSIHHNASTGRWGSHGGVETYTQTNSSLASVEIAKIVQPLITKAMGLRNHGHKTANFHMTRESRMPAILTEGGFMDSTTDIKAMRSDAKLKAQGEAIAEGLATYFKLVPRKIASQPTPSTPPTKEVDEMDKLLPKTQQDDMYTLLKHAYNTRDEKGERIFSIDHSSTVATITRGRATDLMLSYVARTK